MQFQKIEARSNWKALAAELGYMSTILDDPPYWVEALEQPFCAVFSADEITQKIEPATAEILDIARHTVDAICNGGNSNALFDRLKTPISAREAIRKSWNRGDRSLWGRLDFSYNDSGLKLLELNFDGAVSLYESSIFQRAWFQDLHDSGVLPKDTAQSNFIHERLIEFFTDCIPAGQVVHFAAPSDDAEEVDTVRYLQSCAVLAKLRTRFLKVEDLGYTSEGGLLDLESQEVKYLVKLYPWEYLLRQDQKISEQLGNQILVPRIEEGTTTFFEPIWRSLLGNKGILALMKENAPDCKWLLDAAFENTPQADSLKKRPHVKKPIFGMQGSSISIVYPDEPEKNVSNPGTFGNTGYVIQELHPLPTYQDYHMLVGSWVIAGQPAGLALRADLSPITTANNCLFVPHYVQL
jgi:glutathionylspermidine synthase